MKQQATIVGDTLAANVQALKNFWMRTYFHDMVVRTILRVNNRVIITLDDYILVLTGMTHWKQAVDEFPIVWLDHSLHLSERTATLHIDLEGGTIDGEFLNLRLMRRNDLKMLIPSIDQ